MRPQLVPVYRRGIALLFVFVFFAGEVSAIAQRSPPRGNPTFRPGPRYTTPSPTRKRVPVTRTSPITRNAPLGGLRGGMSPGYTRSSNTFSYNGISAPIRGYGGFHSSYYWGAPRWYYWTPFHPAWYYSPPIYSNGYYQPGGFSIFRSLLSVILFLLLIGLIVRLFTGGRRNGGSQYVTYH